MTRQQNTNLSWYQSRISFLHHRNLAVKHLSPLFYPLCLLLPMAEQHKFHHVLAVTNVKNLIRVTLDMKSVH